MLCLYLLPETLFICRSLTVIGSYFCLLYDFLFSFSGTSPPPLTVQQYRCDLLLFTLQAHTYVHWTALECRVLSSPLPRPSLLPGGFLPLLWGCWLGSSGLSDTPSNVSSSSSSLVTLRPFSLQQHLRIMKSVMGGWELWCCDAKMGVQCCWRSIKDEGSFVGVRFLLL